MTQVCATARGQVDSIASGSPFRPSQTTMQASATPRFFKSVSTCNQNLAPSPPSPTHRPRTSRVPSTVTARAMQIGRLATFPPRILLHVHSVQEDHRVDRVEGPVLPLGHAFHHLVDDRGDDLPRHVHAVHLGQMRGDLTSGQTLADNEITM